MDVIISTAPGWTSSWVGLLGLGLLCFGYFFYLLLWHRRYRRPVGPGFTARVEGRVIGRAGALSYRGPEGRLDRAEEVLLVEAEGGSIPIIGGSGLRGLRAGSFLTADGIPVLLTSHPAPCREQADRLAILAARVTVGFWPELRWLRIPVAIGCLLWLAGLACLLLAPDVEGRLFSGETTVEDVPAVR